WWSPSGASAAPAEQPVTGTAAGVVVQSWTTTPAAVGWITGRSGRVRRRITSHGAHHDAVGLAIAPEHEVVAAHVDEAVLGVESDRARIPLPDAEPDRLGAARGGRLERRRHERLREPAPVIAAIDVEAQDLDRPGAGDAGRHLAL